MLAFDCETTGLLRTTSSRPIQLGWVVLDAEGRETEAREVLLKTVEVVPPESSKIHKITTERLRSDGVDPAPALDEFLLAARQVLAAGGLLVAHNAAFDVEMVRRACADCGLQSIRTNDVFCTMTHSTARCELPPFRYGAYKYPKLSELAESLELDYDAAALHGALADARLTTRAYLKGVERMWFAASQPIGSRA